MLPAPDIRVSGDVDFGMVVVEHSVVKTVTLQNEGAIAGEYGIQYDTTLPITISPTISTLQPKGQPNSSIQLQVIQYPYFPNIPKVRIEANQLGPIKTTAQVNFPRGSKTFHITAMVVSQNVELLLPDGNHVLESIHFGTMYFGQERTFNAILVNNAPHPSSFHTTIDSPSEDEEFLLTVPEISVEPDSGKDA